MGRSPQAKGDSQQRQQLHQTFTGEIDESEQHVAGEDGDDQEQDQDGDQDANNISCFK